MTHPHPWSFGAAGGCPTWFTAAGAEVKHRKGRGVGCSHCNAAPARVTTRDELEAYLARHVDCRPPWARKATP